MFFLWVVLSNKFLVNLIIITPLNTTLQFNNTFAYSRQQIIEIFNVHLAKFTFVKINYSIVLLPGISQCSLLQQKVCRAEYVSENGKLLSSIDHQLDSTRQYCK